MNQPCDIIALRLVLAIIAGDLTNWEKAAEDIGTNERAAAVTCNLARLAAGYVAEVCGSPDIAESVLLAFLQAKLDQEVA